MRFFPTFLGLWFFLLWGATTTRAQQQALPRELLLFIEVPTVITATGREQPLTQAPSTITIITAEEIRQSGATSLPELLRSVPGLDFFRSSASELSVAARGVNVAFPARMQVLVDGLSAYEDVTGLVFWHQIPIPLEEIERIEIVRSPATALYGDKALAGIVHIITKSPEALKGTHLSGTAGEAGTGIGHLIHAGVVGNLGYKVSIGHDRTNQFPNPTDGRTSAELGRADTRGHFQVNYRLAEGSRVSLSGGIDEFDRKEVGIAGPLLTVLEGRLGLIKANYALDDFKIQLSYSRFEAALGCQCFLEDISAIAQVYQVQLHRSFPLGHTHVLTGGTTYRFATADAPGLIDRSRKQHLPAFFLQDEWTLRENLALTVGVGVDSHPEAGVSPSPRASLVYSPWKEHTFRAGVALAFRTPSFLENFQVLPFTLLPPPPPPLPQTATGLGNRHLAPEKMLSYEIGYQTLLFNRIKARVDLFYNRLDHLIIFRPIFSQPFPGLPPLFVANQRMNVDGGEIFGGEVGFDVFMTSWLKGFVNYSYQERNGNLAAMADVASRHKGNAGMTFSFPNGLSANVLIHHVGEGEGPFGFISPPIRRVGPYTIGILRLAARFKVFGNEAEAAIQAFNLLNDLHAEIPGGDLIGRRITGTLWYRF